MISRAAAIEHVIGPLDMFEPHPENPRVMDATARCALAASVDRFVLSHVKGFPLRGMPGSGHESGAVKNEPVIVFVRP